MGDPEQEYFSDAMTDDVITELAALAPDVLRVIARTTTMHYKRHDKDVAQIARELGVDYVVEGGVRRTENLMARNVQLVRASTQVQVFAKRYHGNVNDIFKIQSSVAREIADHIEIAPAADAIRASIGIGPPVRRTPTRNLAAYDEYLQGRFHMARITPVSLARARQHLEKATSRDPDFALAYDSLAEIYWYMGYLGFTSPREAFSTGVLHAMRALQIDNTLGETHALLALYHKQLDYDWPEVDREMARALELSPTSPIVRTRCRQLHLHCGLRPDSRGEA